MVGRGSPFRDKLLKGILSRPYYRGRTSRMNGWGRARSIRGSPLQRVSFSRNARQEAFAFRLALNSAWLSQWGGKTLRNCVSSRPIASSRERKTRFLFSSFRSRKKKAGGLEQTNDSRLAELSSFAPFL